MCNFLDINIEQNAHNGKSQLRSFLCAPLYGLLVFAYHYTPERIIHNCVFAASDHVPNYMKRACTRRAILMQQIICARAVIGITMTYAGPITQIRIFRRRGVRQGSRAAINYQEWNEFSNAPFDYP